LSIWYAGECPVSVKTRDDGFVPIVPKGFVNRRTIGLAALTAKLTEATCSSSELAAYFYALLHLLISDPMLLMRRLESSKLR
jgi:hypothetical protein